MHRLALLISLVLVVATTSSCSGGWSSAEEGECLTRNRSETVDCGSPEATGKVLKILHGSSLSVGDCPNGSFALWEIDDKGVCVGSP
ncbi:LppU/SCO3897 family protein [Nonomuraea sp. NBC_01738]|uniref:LppU/SCO3897 family protein n=1 Tax=Nonomuraea sp. NBC_01738 TaxID=2976003 RepID=UPI003FA3DA31